MGYDLHGFLEIEAPTPGEFDSLYDVNLLFPRHYTLFGALAGVTGDVKPLFPRRGVPSGLSCHGFYRCYRPIVDHADALDYRNENFVLPWEVGDADVLPAKEAKWGSSKLGYVFGPPIETFSWLSLAEMRQAIAHAGIDIDALPVEYRFLLKTMENAALIFGRCSRFVFWFSY